MTGHSRSFSEDARAAIYGAIAERRDVRRGFLDEPLPEELLGRLLRAAHSAPSVGLMQPARFIVVRNPEVRRAIHSFFQEANARAPASYNGDRQALYSGVKLEGISRSSAESLCALRSGEPPGTPVDAR